MTSRVRWISVALSLGTSPLGAQAAPDQVAACYEVRLGEWTGSVPSADSLAYSVPPRILLDPSADATSSPDATENRMVRRLGVPEGALQTPHDRTGWVSISTDSARMFWSDGFIGVRARVEWTSTGFVGVARTFTDVNRTAFATADIYGAAVQCDAPLVYRLEDQRRLIRSLPMHGGDSLALGSDLDPAGWSSRRDLMLQGTPALEAPFDNADVVNVMLSAVDGSVRRIRLWYRSPSAYDRLRAALIDANGQPTRATVPDRESSSEWLHWENRTTRISLSRDPRRPDRKVSLLLEDPRAH